MSPETAAALEELTRAILTDAAVGHLGSDLRTTADEILLADGLAVGEGDARQRGSTTEWDLEPVAEEADALDEADEPEDVDATAEPEADETEVPDWVEVSEEPPAAMDADEPSLAEELDGIAREVSGLDRRISPEPSPEPEEETVIARARQIFGGPAEPEARQLAPVPAPQAPTATPEPEPSDERAPRVRARSCASSSRRAPSARRTTIGSPASSRAPRRPSGTSARSPTTAGAAPRSPRSPSFLRSPQEEQAEPPGGTLGGTPSIGRPRASAFARDRTPPPPGDSNLPRAADSVRYADPIDARCRALTPRWRSRLAPRCRTRTGSG